MPFKLNTVFTQLYSKEYYFEENFTLAIDFTTKNKLNLENDRMVELHKKGSAKMN